MLRRDKIKKYKVKKYKVKRQSKTISNVDIKNIKFISVFHNTIKRIYKYLKKIAMPARARSVFQIRTKLYKY